MNFRANFVVLLEPLELARLRLESRSRHELCALAFDLVLFGQLRLFEVRTLRREDLRLEDLARSHVFLEKARDARIRSSRSVAIAPGFAAELRERSAVEGPIFRATTPIHGAELVKERTLKDWFREARKRAGVPEATWTCLRAQFSLWLRAHLEELAATVSPVRTNVVLAERFFEEVVRGPRASL